MHLTAVICTRNRPELIGQAVASVLANDHSDFDLVVVDQSDTGATRVALANVLDCNPKVTYIHTTRVGLSSAYNTAISRSTGDILAFTDDDCIAPPDWLRQIEAAFVREPEAALLYGQVLAPAEYAATPGVLPSLGIPARRRLSRRDGFMIFGMGANFAARRRLFVEVGGFDEVLGGGAPLQSSQDFDLQYRVYRAGGVTVLDPNLVVDHYGHRTPEQWPHTLRAYGVGDGGFFMKHVRCGDLYATWLLTRNIMLNLPRRLIKPLILHRPAWNAYFSGLLQGLRGSYQFGVDRDRRMYVSRKA